MRSVLIAKDFGRKNVLMFQNRVTVLKYTLSCDLSYPKDFNEIINIGIPIGVYRYPPDFLIMRLTEAARRLV